MNHPVEERAQAPQGGRAFVVTITPPNAPAMVSTGRFADAFLAVSCGIALAPEGSRVSARPAIERTEAEGYARYPQGLHPDAFLAAWRGWQNALAEDQPATVHYAASESPTLYAERRARQDDDRALDLQIQANRRNPHCSGAY